MPKTSFVRVSLLLEVALPSSLACWVTCAQRCHECNDFALACIARTPLALLTFETHKRFMLHFAMATDGQEAEALGKLAFAMQAMNTPESRLRGMQFRCRHGDVVISTPPKSGTTLVQQVQLLPEAPAAR